MATEVRIIEQGGSPLAMYVVVVEDFSPRALAQIVAALRPSLLAVAKGLIDRGQLPGSDTATAGPAAEPGPGD